MTADPRRRGSVLITGVIAVFIIASMSAALLTTVLVEDRQSRSNLDVVTGNFLADGAAELAEKAVLKTIVNWLELPEETEYAIDPMGKFPIRFHVTAFGQRTVTTSSDGVRVVNQPILVEAWTTVHGYTRKVQRVLNVGVIPLFQFAVFYDGDLEILPSPDMTISGRIHTNRDLYLGSDHTLTLDSSYVHAVGEIYRQRKDTGAPSGGEVRVRVAGSGGDLVAMESRSDFDSEGIPSVSGFDSLFAGYDANGDGDYIDPGELSPWAIEAMERWQGTVQSSVHGLKELVAPDVRSIRRYVPTEGGTGGDYDLDPVSGEYYRVPQGTGAYRKGHYHAKADLVILDGEAFDSEGDSVALPPGVLADRTMYDAREEKWITLTEIDLRALGDAGLWPHNGLLYAARSDASPDTPNGIRLVHGERLDSGLTVVSEDPIFLLGNYNVDQKKGAAVIGDAVNILSGAWDDSKIPGSLPDATPTTVMASIITGAYDTTLGDYNGGFENLLRFHEDWSGVQCKIRGSFVNLFRSQIAMAPWGFGGDRYRAPIRNFDFDRDYRIVSKLPPFTPVVAHVRQIAWNEKHSGPMP